MLSAELQTSPKDSRILALLSLSLSFSAYAWRHVVDETPESILLLKAL